MKNELFRKLPKVDQLMRNSQLAELMKSMDYNSFYQAVVRGIEDFRKEIKEEKLTRFEEADIIEKIKEIANKMEKRALRKVINGTGVILHTNLGRAFFNEKTAERLKEIVTGYCNLEYDLEKGERGSRHNHLEKIICEVTGAEGAMIVNNNAAAVILCLNEFAKGKKVIVSRGELVEIGGSFRMPEIMELSGGILKEVGTTNKTYIEDYERAVDEETDVLLKVHTSNYKIIGFTQSVKKSQLAELGKRKKIITIDDIGSGILIDYSKYGLSKEATVQESLASGMDIVTFSGDKMLGGAQCGIIVGKKELIERLKKNSYARAFRIDKMSIAVMEEIFRYYLEESRAIKEIPILKMLTEKADKVLERAKKLREFLKEREIETEIIKTSALVGGGAMPDEKIESYGIVFKGEAEILERKFRNSSISMIGRIKDNNFLLDMKCIKEKDIEYIAEEAVKIFL